MKSGKLGNSWKKNEFLGLWKKYFGRNFGIKHESFFNLIADSESYKPQQKVLKPENQKDI